MKIHKAIKTSCSRQIKKYYLPYLVENGIKVVYLCNQVMHANEKRYSFDWNKVTCKNCLRYRKGKDERK